MCVMATPNIPRIRQKYGTFKTDKLAGHPKYINYIILASAEAKFAKKRAAMCVCLLWAVRMFKFLKMKNKREEDGVVR
ncbi:hypothetical protein X798_05077 [Onchocerca flexuosa]|uniref:Uncharacterized protein n=1 Tax=Onchocerca flexuosa TaxID=387005 RepID=A0A238BT51_9BILA|nr:hypothetical protein X798_05077 [Onchocerca flexuosa]